MPKICFVLPPCRAASNIVLTLVAVLFRQRAQSSDRSRVVSHRSCFMRTHEQAVLRYFMRTHGAHQAGGRSRCC